jgi:heptosyltransferase-2
MGRIGIWNTAFLGDAVLTLPLIRTVKAAFPDSPIDFYVRKGVESLFTAQPELDNVYGYDKRGAQKSIFAAMSYGRELAKKEYSLWISAHTSLRSGVIARWTSAHTRIGYNKPRFNNWLYTTTVDRKFPELEEIDRLMQLVTPLSITKILDWPEMVLPQSAYDEVDVFWSKHIDSPVLGVHPGSVWATKRWPAEYYADVVAKAIDAGAQVMVFAGPGEESMAQEVIDKSGTQDSDRLIDLSGALTLVQLAAYLNKLNCYVSNDSGPMHLAWAQRTPVTAIFGPTVRELGFFPRGETSTVLETDIRCRPCGLHGPKTCPKGHFNCMHSITPDMVWNDAKKKLFA